MSEEKLNKEGLKKVWLKFWTLIKVLVGDVDVEGKGNLQAQIDDLTKMIVKQSGNIEEFDSKTSYQIGRYCLYKGIMYKCVQNTEGEWNPESWKQTTTLEEINAMQKQLDKVLGNNSDGDGLGFAEGIKSNNIIDALNEVFTLGSDNKQKLVDNFTAMGMHASTDDSWGTLINKILDMTDTSKDTVTVDVLLAGYTAHDATGELVNGGMDEYAAVTVDATNVTQDSDYTYFEMPAGHYDENSKVRSQNSNLKSNFFIELTPAYPQNIYWDISLKQNNNSLFHERLLMNKTYEYDYFNLPIYVSTSWKLTIVTKKELLNFDTNEIIPPGTTLESSITSPTTIRLTTKP
ncbi:MAG: hypothetical protein K2G55_18525 [Lachnospiraceae bacterium]|nr:hypothetical protein [Lachnospiraceae bacterium]MDE7204054.1 hypothetical protein [Lachnospiraceae bacterium]